VLFAHAVDFVDRVTLAVALDTGEVIIRGDFAGGHHRVADRGLDAKNGFEKWRRIGHRSV
jgi:hypothetical protein